MTMNMSGATFGANQSFSKAGLGPGTTSTISIANEVQYAIEGIAYSKTPAANQAPGLNDAVTGKPFKPLPTPTADKGAMACVFVVALDGPGNIAVIQGPLVDAEDLANGVTAMQLPGVPSTHAPIGMIAVRGSATQVAPWTMGVSNSTGVLGVTHTYVDLSSLPAMPIK